MKKLELTERFMYAFIAFGVNIVLFMVAFFLVMGRPWGMDAIGNYAFMSLIVALGFFWALSINHKGVLVFQVVGFILSQCFMFSQAFQRNGYQTTLIYTIVIYVVCLVASILYYQNREIRDRMKQSDES